MKIKLFIEKQDDWGQYISCKFVDMENGSVIATATNNIDEYSTLLFKDKKYELVNIPKKFDREQLNSKYPLCSKSKWAIGFNIACDNNKILSYYHDALTCSKKFIFKKNIGVEIYKYDNKVYECYKVGFAKENWHNYCVYNNNKTVSIIRRFYGEEHRAILYIKDKKDLLISLLICMVEIVDYANGSSGNRIDPSAGNYISTMVEEKEMFDKSFIDSIK